MDVFKKIEQCKIVPVAVIEDSKNAIPLGDSLINAELPIIEITFRTKAAAESISNIAKKFPEILIGAGTILTIDQAKNAVENGSQFIVTPGFNPKVVDYCIDNDVVIVPGIDSPTFVEWGLERGLTHLKFFPADIAGGVKMLQALSGPYPDVKFIPTGGINEKNLLDYLRLKNVCAVGGSWIVNKELISSKQFDKIENLTKNALALIKSTI